jgi:5S rRNA maturation endonuclease (ribonuclease M5)
MVYPVVLQTEAILGRENGLGSARTKRLDNSGESRRMSRAVQRRATNSYKHGAKVIPDFLPAANLHREERRFREFASFLRDLVKELNDLSSEGAAVLVEGKRDATALALLGYSGPIFTVAILTSNAASRERLRREVSKMVILTDLDSEGRRLASRYLRFLSQEGISPSLAQRRRLSKASRGTFFHVENLRRFALGVQQLPDVG